jgi:hypothetical protein
MNIDFKSLERRYGTLLALKINEEIARADQRHFAFYQLPKGLKHLHHELFDHDDDLDCLQKLAG